MQQSRAPSFAAGRLPNIRANFSDFSTSSDFSSVPVTVKVGAHYPLFLAARITNRLEEASPMAAMSLNPQPGQSSMTALRNREQTRGANTLPHKMVPCLSNPPIRRAWVWQLGTSQRCPENSNHHSATADSVDSVCTTVVVTLFDQCLGTRRMTAEMGTMSKI